MFIGALSERTGCHIETIRYYERIKLLPKPERTGGGHRIYTNEQLKRPGFIRCGRELGFSLDEIRTLLRLVDGKRYTCQEVKTITETQVEEVKRKIADLRRLQKTLTAISGQCKGRLIPDRPIIDTLFSEM